MPKRRIDIEMFERKLSLWLDQPQCERLRAEIERLVAELPELAAVRRDWQRVNDLLCGRGAAPEGVEWDRLRTAILRAVLGAKQGPQTVGPPADAATHSEPCDDGGSHAGPGDQIPA